MVQSKEKASQSRSFSGTTASQAMTKAEETGEAEANEDQVS